MLGNMRMIYRCYALDFLLFTLQPAYAGTTCEPVWEEDFTGPLDDTVWTVVEGDSCAEGICGWGKLGTKLRRGGCID